MKVEKNKSLRKLNTFGFDQQAEFYCQPATLEDLQEAIEFACSRRLKVFILGAGSNLVLTQNIAGLVIKPALNSTQFVQHEQGCDVFVEAGVNWHSLVRDAVERNYYGLENLSLIPGNAGAAPIQNIGAYGSELSQILIKLEAIDIASRQVVTLTNEDCQFGYRDSVFKHKLSGAMIIVKLQLRLSDKPQSAVRYQALTDELQRREWDKPNAQQISDAVCHIRQSKLPDPAQLGNAGSFFKNPVITRQQLGRLLSEWPDLPYHTEDSQHSKIPAAWLIEKAGWKGYRDGNVGVYAKQPLVLVHFGQGSGKELMALASAVKKSVKQKFNLDLEQEPKTI